MRYGIVVSLLFVAQAAYAGQPRMAISAPGGGETFVTGQLQNFVYSGKSRFKNLAVDISYDGGATWQPIGTIDNKVKDQNKRNVIPWKVTGTPSNYCMIRMSGTAGSGKNKKTYNVNSAMFSIDGASAGALPPEGPIGPQGPSGLDGLQGPEGPQGPAGPEGPQGPAGAQGPAGIAGEKGDIGSSGPPGADGLPGPQGLKGEKGDTGATGPQGEKGDAGAIGAQGPKGDAGAVGAQGAQGPKGDTGATGAQGPKGDIGSTGPQGVKGDAGAVGAQGPKGDAGAVGPAGAQGPAGPAGPAGPQGPQGAAGPTGPNGSTTVSYINYASTANAVLTSSKHDGTLVISDPNIRGPSHPKGRSQIFFSFSTASAAGVGGVVSLSGAGLKDGEITVIITTQNYAIKTTDNIDYHIINGQ